MITGQCLRLVIAAADTFYWIILEINDLNIHCLTAQKLSVKYEADVKQMRQISQKYDFTF